MLLAARRHEGRPGKHQARDERLRRSTRQAPGEKVHAESGQRDVDQVDQIERGDDIEPAQKRQRQDV